jgi:hypothetical protein
MTATPALPGHCDRIPLLLSGNAALLLGLAVVMSGCNLVPSMAARGHRIDPEEEARLSAVAYQEILATHPLSQDTASIQQVQQVGDRLAKASGRTDITWDFKLVEDNSPRAIALPGGRVIVADATLGVCQNEAQLAAVIAGAMGRQLARHAPSEIGDDVNTADGSNRPTWQSPPSAESDSIALSILVGAGYDPEAAQQIWFGTQSAGADANTMDATAQSRTARHGSFQLALDRARFIYRSHPQPLGYGHPIAWSPHSVLQPGPTPADQEVWTAAINRGAAKPSEWDADLETEPAPLTTVASRQHAENVATSAGDEFLPPRAGHAIQPAVYEWSSADAAPAPLHVSAEPLLEPVELEPVEPAAFESPGSSTTPATLPGPMLP